MKKILTVSLGALLIATAANADIASVDYVTNVLKGKQDTISDLDTIRSGAVAGASALQKADIKTGTSNGTISVDGDDVSVKGLGSAAYTASTAYATAAQGTLAASAVQPGDLAAVATSGSYNDLTGKPTIPSGALASKNTITNADVADNAAIAQSKINGLTTALNSKQDKLTIDSELSKTSTNPVQNKVVTEELDRKQNASTAVEVTTAGTAVGTATIPVYVNASGVATAITSYSGTAAKATADASGQTITTTYATKTELAGKQDKLTIDSALNTGSTNPVQNMVVAKALNEKQAALGYTPENVANKVPTATGLTASSTDTQYPSAKLVYTALNGKQDKLVVDENIRAAYGVALEQAQDGMLSFIGLQANSNTPGVLYLHNDVAGDALDGTVTQSAIKTALATKQAALGYTPENVTNKVKSTDGLTASSTDTQYPSAKLVYTAVNGKQDTISDLNTIRSGAAAGATALQKADIKTGTSNGTISVDGTNVAVQGLGSAAYTASTAYATAAQGALAASAVQPAALGNYATKTELTTGLADKQVAAPVGESGDNFYVTNNDGAWVDMFTAMPRDPECAEEKCALTYKAGKYAWEVVRQ